MTSTTLEAELWRAFAATGDSVASMRCSLSAEVMARPLPRDDLWPDFQAWGTRYVYFPLCYDPPHLQWVGWALREPAAESAHPQGSTGVVPLCYFGCDAGSCVHMMKA